MRLEVFSAILSDSRLLFYATDHSKLNQQRQLYFT
jgi:hypothetical protein